MYKYYRTVGLATIASPINQNLALLDVDEHLTADTLAVIHEGYINVIPIVNATRHSKYVSLLSGPGRGNGIVKEVKWVRLRGETMFVVLSTEGLHIYDAEVTEVKYKHCCKDRGDGNDYTIGACVMKSSLLCVGTNTGVIWVFTCDESNTNFSIVDRIFGHDSEIKLLDGSGEYMISASKDAVYLWIQQNNDFHITRKLTVHGLSGEPTTLKYSNYTAFLGYDSGEFCTHDIFDKKLNTRTVAHRLTVSAIDFSLLKYYIMTTSLDCYVKIWSFQKEYSKATCTCLFSVLNGEGPVCGGGFLNYSCTEFCIVTANQLGVQFYIQDYKTEKPAKDVEV